MSPADLDLDRLAPDLPAELRDTAAAVRGAFHDAAGQVQPSTSATECLAQAQAQARPPRLIDRRVGAALAAACLALVAVIIGLNQPRTGSSWWPAGSPAPAASIQPAGPTPTLGRGETAPSAGGPVSGSYPVLRLELSSADGPVTAYLSCVAIPCALETYDLRQAALFSGALPAAAVPVTGSAGVSLAPAPDGRNAVWLSLAPFKDRGTRWLVLPSSTMTAAQLSELARQLQVRIDDAASQGSRPAGR